MRARATWIASATSVVESRERVRGQADGLLQVTVPISFGLGLVAPLMPEFRRKHPGVRLELRLEDRLLDLALEGMDVAIRVAGLTPESTSLIAHLLVTFRRVLVAAPEYLKRKGEPKTPEALTKHDLLGHPVEPWALANDTHSGQRHSPCRAAGRSPHSRSHRRLAYSTEPGFVGRESAESARH